MASTISSTMASAASAVKQAVTGGRNQMLVVTEGDSILGFYVARAAIHANEWGKVRVGVNDKNHELSRSLAKDGAQIMEVCMEDKSSIERFVENADAMVLVPPRDFEAPKAVKCVMQAIKELRMPVTVAAPAQAPAAADKNKLRALVLLSCIAAAHHQGASRGSPLQPTPSQPRAGAGAGAPEASHHERIPRVFMELEETVKNACSQATIARLTVPLQSCFMIAPSIAEHGIFPMSCGDQERYTLVNLKDAGMALSKVACCNLEQSARTTNYSGQTLTLTGSELVTARQLAQIASKALNAEVKYKNVTFDEMADILKKNARSGHGGSGRGGRHERCLQFEIAEWLALSTLIKNGKLNIMTKDLQRILGREPLSVAAFWQENRSAFAPKGGKTSPVQTEPQMAVCDRQQ